MSSNPPYCSGIRLVSEDYQTCYGLDEGDIVVLHEGSECEFSSLRRDSEKYEKLCRQCNVTEYHPSLIVPSKDYLQRLRSMDFARAFASAYRLDELTGWSPIDDPVYEAKFIDDDIGHGLFATRDIPDEYCLFEYSGLLSVDDISRSSFDGYKICYPGLDLRTGRMLTLSAFSVGNHARLINHSIPVNVAFRVAILENIPRIIVVTTRKIQKGEEFYVDYGELYWVTASRFGKKPLELPSTVTVTTLPDHPTEQDMVVQ